MAKQRLDPKLLEKLVKRLGGKSLQYVREQISRRAERGGISSEAALVLWCKENSIGTTQYLNKQPEWVREQVRSGIGQSNQPRPPRPATIQRPPRRKIQPKMTHIVDAVIEDQQLRERCRDILSAPKNHDRVIREATTVLDSRLKTLTGIKGMSPNDLVGKVLKPDPTKAVIEVSSEPQEQEGFFKLCNGIMLAYRNSTHHSLSDKFSQADALKFCGTVDLLLDVIGKGTIHKDRI